jgi:adenylate cyclase
VELVDHPALHSFKNALSRSRPRLLAELDRTLKDVREGKEMTAMNDIRSVSFRSRNVLMVLFVVVLSAGLPLAVWLDLRNLTEAAPRRQAADLNSIISSIRGYYANDVVGRILASPEPTKVMPNYRDIPGAIPVPATLSIELGRVVNELQSNITYRFVSDFPFKNRAPHELDSFERNALGALRQKPNQQFAEVVEVSSSLATERIRHIVPIVMNRTCVSCHDSHPDSPKRDWKIGDVRGIQRPAPRTAGGAALPSR